MEVVGTKGGVTLGALALASVIASLDTLKAEDVEALGEYRILFPHVTAGAGQASLVVLYLLHQNLITLGHIVWLLGGFQLPSKPRDVLLCSFEIEQVFFFGDTVLYNFILKVMELLLSQFQLCSEVICKLGCLHRLALIHLQGLSPKAQLLLPCANVTLKQVLLLFQLPHYL